MKIVIIMLFCLISVGVYAQLDELKGTWINGSQDCIVIRDTIEEYGSSTLSNRENAEDFSLHLSGDTLIFQNSYYSSATNYTQLYIERYDLKVMRLSDSVLIVRPCSKLSQFFFGGRKEIKFIRQKYSRDSTIHFEKIIYHTTYCFGDCPEIYLEIDSSKKIYLNGRFLRGSSTQTSEQRSGQFEGVLSDSLYDELLLLLQTCNLKTLYWRPSSCCDGPLITIIVYFDGQKKYLKSMFPPIISNDLIGYLYLINDRAKLERTNTKRTLEE